jgi:hypothetical protein
MLCSLMLKCNNKLPAGTHALAPGACKSDFQTGPRAAKDSGFHVGRGGDTAGYVTDGLLYSF